jgi:hypothetical protein
MAPEDIMLSQSQKDKYHVFSHMQKLKSNPQSRKMIIGNWEGYMEGVIVLEKEWLDLINKHCMQYHTEPTHVD